MVKVSHERHGAKLGNGWSGSHSPAAAVLRHLGHRPALPALRPSSVRAVHMSAIDLLWLAYLYGHFIAAWLHLAFCVRVVTSYSK